jgi:hypothetical protein
MSSEPEPAVSASDQLDPIHDEAIIVPPPQSIITNNRDSASRAAERGRRSRRTQVITAPPLVGGVGVTSSPQAEAVRAEVPQTEVAAEPGPASVSVGAHDPTVTVADEDTQLEGTASGASRILGTAAGSHADALKTWETIGRGLIQAKLESVVCLICLSEIAAFLEADDQWMLDGIRSLLDKAAKTVEAPPDKDVVGAALRWLGRKVDRFIDAAVTTAGGLAGAAATVAVAKHVPMLQNNIRELLELADRS